MERIYLDREELVSGLVEHSFVNGVACLDLDHDVLLVRTAANIEFAANEVDVMSPRMNQEIKIMDGESITVGLKSDYESVRDTVVNMIYSGKASKSGGYHRICLSVANDFDIKTALEFKKLA